jgi:hypothetical protein
MKIRVLHKPLSALTKPVQDFSRCTSAPLHLDRNCQHQMIDRTSTTTPSFQVPPTPLRAWRHRQPLPWCHRQSLLNFTPTPPPCLRQPPHWRSARLTAAETTVRPLAVTSRSPPRAAHHRKPPAQPLQRPSRLPRESPAAMSRPVAAEPTETPHPAGPSPRAARRHLARPQRAARPLQSPTATSCPAATEPAVVSPPRPPGPPP